MDEHREAIGHIRDYAHKAKWTGDAGKAAVFTAAADALERLGQDDAPALAARVRRLEALIEQGIRRLEMIGEAAGAVGMTDTEELAEKSAGELRAALAAAEGGE